MEQLTSFANNKPIIFTTLSVSDSQFDENALRHPLTSIVVDLFY